MFIETGINIFTADPFIYRINPEDYISLTNSLLLNRKLFQEINEAGEASPTENQRETIQRYSSVLKRWRNARSIDTGEMIKDFNVYRYFYKEMGASLKFNPLSDNDTGNYFLGKIFEMLVKYQNLITPKAVYTTIETESDSRGLLVKGTNFHFESSKLKIFTGHSNHKSDKEILPEELTQDKVIVYVVTIGPELDYEVGLLADAGEILDAYLLNGIGAGAAEMVANDLNLYMNDTCSRKECSYRRISPGYGDWPVSDQEKIFSLLLPEENIGVTLTDSHIMLPEKSTSGIMGLISL